jgi:hypothetical protein
MIPTARVQRVTSEAARCASTGDRPSHPGPFFSILLEIQTQELIVFGRQIQAGPVAGEPRNDAAMFFAEPGRAKGLAKVLPSRGSVVGQARALQRRQRVNGGGEGTNGFLDALIGRRQPELGVERFEVMTKLLSKRHGMVGCEGSWFRHGGWNR